MYSAEPLPHFVDEYLAWLHETHPTNATFDGVHLHDDLLEDLSRAAIDAQIRDLGGFARRLAAIDPARLTDSERIERPALDANIRSRLFELETVRTWERNPQYYGDLLSTSLAGQVLFDYAPLPERARRVLSKLHQVPRLMQSARDNIKDPPGIFIKVGLESLRGALRFIESDLPRAFGGLHDMRVLGDLADASTEAAQAIGVVRVVPGERAGAARAGLIPSRTRRLSAEAAPRRGDRARPRPPARDREPRAAGDAGRVPPRRVTARPEAEGSRRRVGESQARSPRGRPGRRHGAGAARRAEDLHPAPGHRVAAGLRGSASRADPAVLPLDLRQHVDARALRDTPAARLLLHHRRRILVAGRAAGRTPPRLQLRRAVGHLDPRGLPRPLPPLSAPASGVGDVQEVDPVFVDRDGGRLGALCGTDDGRCRLPQAGSERSASASSPKR